MTNCVTMCLTLCPYLNRSLHEINALSVNLLQQSYTYIIHLLLLHCFGYNELPVCNASLCVDIVSTHFRLSMLSATDIVISFRISIYKTYF